MVTTSLGTPFNPIVVQWIERRNNVPYVIEFYRSGVRAMIAEHSGPIDQARLEAVSGLKIHNASYAVVIDVDTFAQMRVNLCDGTADG